MRNLAFGLSLTGIVCSPAFGFAGVGFPRAGDGRLRAVWGALLPLRWYMQILFDQAARGVPPVAFDRAVCRSWRRWRWSTSASPCFGCARSPASRCRRRRRCADGAAGAAGLVGAFAAEYGRVLRDRGAFGLIVLAPIIYGVFYPQPYLGQLVRAIPIAVVDERLRPS